MRCSLFAVLSGLGALAVVNALPAENLQRSVPSEDIICPEYRPFCECGYLPGRPPCYIPVCVPCPEPFEE
ncbi:hypothetical protein OG21DRAFT_1507652 [Imleria badia]|nr:hypothetical protein OG21DRAFT_1507652 [Imleria badia]